MKIHLLTIGDEILIGQIADTNSAWMARELNGIGAQVTGKETVGDELEDIQGALRRGLERADAVLVTGGLGPTKDDVTKKALAEYFGVGFVFSQETFNHIDRFLTRLGRVTNEMHRAQCLMPQNALLLHNRMGTAPGMWFDEKGKVVVSMPGVPFEMEYLMQAEVLPRLRKRFGASPIIHHTLLTAGEGESRIAERLRELEDRLPKEVKLAYLPSLGQVRLRLTARGDDETRLRGLLEQEAKKIEEALGNWIFGKGEESLEGVVGDMLKARGLMISTAESCTGGYLAHRITSVPGSSNWYKGSVIAYSNELKMKLLGVNAETLETYGAVSEETVVEMVRGALDRLETDIAVAVSGIAGPDGGTPEKPVGTIWIAVGNQEVIRTHRLQLWKDRLKNIQFTSVFALVLVRKFLLGEWV